MPEDRDRETGISDDAAPLFFRLSTTPGVGRGQVLEPDPASLASGIRRRLRIPSAEFIQRSVISCQNWWRAGLCLLGEAPAPGGDGVLIADHWWLADHG